MLDARRLGYLTAYILELAHIDAYEYDIVIDHMISRHSPQSADRPFPFASNPKSNSVYNATSIGSHRVILIAVLCHHAMSRPWTSRARFDSYHRIGETKFSIMMPFACFNLELGVSQYSLAWQLANHSSSP